MFIVHTLQNGSLKPDLSKLVLVCMLGVGVGGGGRNGLTEAEYVAMEEDTPELSPQAKSSCPRPALMSLTRKWEARLTLNLEFACWCSYTRTPPWDKIWLEVRSRRLFLLLAGGRKVPSCKMPCSREQAPPWMAAAQFTLAHGTTQTSSGSASNKLVKIVTTIHLVPDG